MPSPRPLALSDERGPPSGQNRMIYGPKLDGTYIVEFRIANAEALAIRAGFSFLANEVARA